MSNGTSFSSPLNVISGNAVNGVEIANTSVSSSQQNLVQGNYIGTDSTGKTGMNGTNEGSLGNLQDGVYVYNSSFATIGGQTTVNSKGVASCPGNVISNNFANGVELKNASNILIAGNFVGLGISNELLGNGEVGVLDTGGKANMIGESASGTGNTIWSNTLYDVSLNSDTNVEVWSDTIVAAGGQYCVYVANTTGAEFEGDTFYASSYTDSSGKLVYITPAWKLPTNSVPGWLLFAVSVRGGKSHDHLITQ